MSIVPCYCTLSLLLCSLICSSVCLNFNATAIPGLVDGNPPIISAIEDTKNVSMFCAVFDTSNGDQVLTRWSLSRNSSNPVFFLFTLNGTGREFFENFMVTSVEDRRSELTILVFNNSFDNTQIGCGGDENILSKFDLRIIKSPVLRMELNDQTPVEGDTFEFNIEEIQGFPVIPESFTWFFNGILFNTSSSLNVSVYPFIKFTDINRNNSGNYSIIVTNEGGIASGFVLLNVQYKPEGIAQIGPKYALAGEESVTIIGFMGIDGNPNPSSMWSRNSVTINGVRFNTSTPGVLTIFSIVEDDAGNYTNTLNNTVNGVAMSISNTVELVVAVSPSMPRNVTVLGIAAEYVNISWRNPMNLGNPNFDQFTIRAVSLNKEVVIIVDASNSFDSEHINTHIVEGLKPSTEYHLNVSASSTVEQLGALVSEPSETIQFNTTVGAPSISRAVLNNTRGNLSVSWQFLHTGGSSLETIMVQCIEEGEEDILDDASADPLAVMKNCITSEECSPGSVSIGPVVAGVNYSCLVTAENDIGSDKMRTNYLVATTGIPSVPVINSVEGGAGSASLTLKVDQFGVNGASDFTFIVSVFESSKIPKYKRMIIPISIDNPIVTIVVNDLPTGTYSFTVASSNPYGSSMPSNRSNQVTVQPGPTTPSTTTMDRTTLTTTLSSTSSSSIGGPVPTLPPPRSNRLSGGAIAGIVIAILILVAIIAIVVFIVIYIVYQNRGGSYQVEPGKRGGVKVEEFDIDLGTELQPKEPAQVAPEKPPETNEYSSVEPKAELHYADLADFGPVKSKGQSVPAPQAAKPMPIEEVQYAVIVPQEKKSQGAEGGQ